MSYGYIYEITNNIDGKKYVGQHKGDGNDIYMGSGKRLKAAIKKYGIENFSKRILNFYDTRNELNDAEKYFIAVYRYFYSPKMLYNIADGGEGFSGKHSEAAKHKMSKARIGKHHSEETKTKISKAMTGNHHTEATKQKMSINHADITGEKHPMYGKHHSEETKKKQSEALKGLQAGEKSSLARKVAQYDLNGNFIRTWNYIKEAENELGINHSSISKCCKGKRKSAGKFIWKYVD